MSEVVPVLGAFGYFAVISVVLAVIDARTHRLPNRIVLPAYPVALAMFAIACLLGAEWSALLRALLGMAALFSFYLVLRMIGGAGMGGGDVKLAGVLGLYLGWLGWPAVLVGVVAGFVLGGVYGLVLIALRRAHRRTAIPFGPFMLAGAWLSILAHTVAAPIL